MNLKNLYIFQSVLIILLCSNKINNFKINLYEPNNKIEKKKNYI